MGKHLRAAAAVAALVSISVAGAMATGVVGAASASVSTPHFYPVSDTTQPATVPAEYQSTYSTIQAQVQAFAALPQAATGPSTSSTIMSAADEAADGNTMVPGVLQTNQLNNSEQYALQLKNMGDNGVTVQVNYPLLVTSFSDSAEYTSFYTQLATYIHSIGLSLTIEDNPLFPNHSTLPVSTFYSSLTLQNLISTDQQQVQTIINDMQPTYVEFLAEPDTYTSNFNNPAIDFNCSKSQTNCTPAVQFVQGVLSGLQRNGAKVGAGSGTWEDDTLDKALTAQTSIDFLDMHTYPIAGSGATVNDVQNMAQQTADAAAAHIPVVMTECWLYKDSTDGHPYSLSDPQGSSLIEDELVTYGFWESLDQQFLTAMVNYARNNNFALISPFASEEFFAYQSWTSAFDTESHDQILKAHDQAVSAARNGATVSALGGTIEALNGNSSSSSGAGYWMLSSGGTVDNFGSAGALGSPGASASPWVAMAAFPGGGGYWTVTASGKIDAFGSATTYTLSANPSSVVSIAATADGKGYWLATATGQILTAGDATSYGSPAASNITLSKPISNMVATPDGKGYWLLGGDGGVFTYGDAGYYGSTGNIHLVQPAVAMTPTSDGKGYVFVASDGGIFAFGDATYYGSTYQVNPSLKPGGSNSVAPLNQPVNGIVVTSDGKGYWMVAADGGVFAFGDAGFVGSLGGTKLTSPIVAFAAV